LFSVMFICTLVVKYSFAHMFLDNLILDRFVAYTLYIMLLALLAYKIFSMIFCAFVSF